MDSVELIGRLIVSLAVVIGLIFFIAKRARGSARRKVRSDRLIDVLGRQSLSRSASIAVVRVAGQGLVLGVTEGRISVLSQIELDAVSATLAPSAPAAAATTTGAAAGSAIGEATTSPAAPRTGNDLLAALATEEEILAAARAVQSTRGGHAPSPVASPHSYDVTPATGTLAGSALSPATWKQTLGALREMTVRKG